MHQNQNLEPKQPDTLLPQQIGFNALQGVVEAETAKAVEIVVPRGWTTLIQGTDTERWQLGDPVKEIKGQGLSVITAEEAARARATRERLVSQGIATSPEAYDTTASYGHARTPGAESVEVRVLFYREDLKPRRGSAPEVADIKAGLSPDTLKLISKYHQARHPVVPHHERLIRLAGTYDESTNRHVEYFVPSSVQADYLEAVARGQVEA